MYILVDPPFLHSFWRIPYIHHKKQLYSVFPVLHHRILHISIKTSLEQYYHYKNCYGTLHQFWLKLAYCPNFANVKLKLILPFEPTTIYTGSQYVYHRYCDSQLWLLLMLMSFTSLVSGTIESHIWALIAQTQTLIFNAIILTIIQISFQNWISFQILLTNL